MDIVFFRVESPSNRGKKKEEKRKTKEISLAILHAPALECTGVPKQSQAAKDREKERQEVGP